MLIPKVILEALVQSLRSVLPGGTTLLQVGETHDSSLSPAWVECWVDRVASPVARRTASQCRIDLSFTVNCLGRPPATPSQVQTLAETIRRNLTCLSMPFQSPAGGSGLVTLLEAEMRDLSRPATQKSASLLQWTVTVRGTLYPCSPAQQ